MSESKRERYIRLLKSKADLNFVELTFDAVKEIIELLEETSAEPERLTDDDFETIRIHLNAQKEKLCNQQRWEEAEEYQRIIDRFTAFASAQPDLQPTCNNLATDTISRQVAIDAVNKIAPVNTEYDCTLLDILDVRYVLTELPSAESELIWCKDCKHRGEKPINDGRYWCNIHNAFMYYCSDAERKEGKKNERHD